MRRQRRLLPRPRPPHAPHAHPHSCANVASDAHADGDALSHACGRCSPVAVQRIDLGALLPYTDGAGHVWQPDRAYSPGSWGWEGNGAVYTTTTAIAATDDDVLYQSERWWIGRGSYRVDLPNGDYKVWLHLAEIYPWAVRGTRVFTVLLEDQPLLATWTWLPPAGSSAPMTCGRTST